MSSAQRLRFFQLFYAELTNQLCMHIYTMEENDSAAPWGSSHPSAEEPDESS